MWPIVWQHVKEPCLGRNPLENFSILTTNNLVWKIWWFRVNKKKSPPWWPLWPRHMPNDWWRLPRSSNNNNNNLQKRRAKVGRQLLLRVAIATTTKKTAIQPEHVLQAFYARRQQGQDPGFFLQANECINIATQPMDNNNAGKEQMKLVAALAAQEECDKTFKEYKEAYEKRKLDESKRKADNESNKEKANNDTEMKEEKMNTEMKESDEEKPATTTTEVKAPAAEEATTNNATTKPEDTTKTTTTKPEDSDSGDDDEIDLEMDED
ncbi:expressed unknown protein [Seminavis robusta]|uniref:Uncharacterized protein n=1 Tax=Seminavis robusta TaxID=568900 RepID=A0A9N8EMP4_9STRA|nr:expressed unknown protein [Seminavis robusta]|eukprot:Sro1558_g282300.1 n/a (266) ;mRNA; f:633-1430